MLRPLRGRERIGRLSFVKPPREVFMPISRRLLLATAPALPVVLRSGAARAAGPTLRFALSAYPPNLLPFVSTGQSAVTAKLMMYRGLLSFAPDGAVQGELAESWARDGGNGFVFKLREAVFHDGSPVTADDVAFTLGRIQTDKQAYLRGQMEAIERVETPDPRTVHVVLKAPVAVFPLWLADPQCAVVQRKAFEADGSYVGAGPYTLAAQERGVSLDFVAFPKFYKPGLPKTATVRMIVYADENARVAALRAGDVDIIEYVPWASMTELEKDKKLRMDGSVGPFMNLLFNGGQGPFKDVRVRQAAAYAIRREEIVQAAFFGRGSVLGGMPIPPGTEFYDASLADYWHYDKDKAKALLAAAGVPNGFSCTLLATAQYLMHKTTAEVVQSHLGEIGINCKLNLPEWGQRVALGYRGQYEIAVFGTSCANNDPDGMQSVLDGDLPAVYGRSYAMPTPEIHKLFEAGRAEFDPAKRKAIYTDLQKRALADAPMVTLCWRLQSYAMTTGVQGFRSLPGALSINSGITIETTSLA
jgi:peptide/nickel transport system substrate-binding protein